jgi:hypothetical protein
MCTLGSDLERCVEDGTGCDESTEPHMRFRTGMVAIAAAAVVATACGSSDATSPNTNQFFLHYEGTSAKVVAMEVGVTLRVVAETRDAVGNPVTGLAVQYRSSRPEFVAVSASGVVSARAVGTAYVIATARLGATTLRDSVTASVARSLGD